MDHFAYCSFLASFGMGLIFFITAKRRCDFLAVGFVGAAFYFSPLIFGYVVQSGPYDPSIPDPVYWIGTGYIIALLAGALISDRFPESDSVSGQTTISPWYAAVAVTCLVIAIVQSRGSIINIDKAVVLKNVGVAYVIFEIAASFAFLAAIIERRWAIAMLSATLILADVFIGFRLFAVFTAIGTTLLLLRSKKRVRLYRKIPTYGLGAVVFVAAILLAHTARVAAFRIIENPETIRTTQEMRGDTLQYLNATETNRIQVATVSPNPPPAPKFNFEMPSWAMAPLRIFMQSEQFLTQAVLVETVHQGYSCSAKNILKSLFLLLPPGLGRIVPSPFPPTFYDEYQPVLFPGLNYGLGGNVWAEMLCRFGYAGDAAFAVILVAALAGLSRAFARSSQMTCVPIAMLGVVLGFYFHRNDLHVELVMLRQIAMVFIAVFLLARAWSRIPLQMILFRVP